MGTERTSEILEILYLHSLSRVLRLVQVQYI